MFAGGADAANADDAAKSVLQKTKVKAICLDTVIIVILPSEMNQPKRN
jgi:hypothetical protein